MKNNFLILLFLGLGFILLFFFSCKHQLINPNDPGAGGGTGGGGVVPPSSTCSPDSVYFVNDIMPMIASNCTMSGCHGNVATADGIYLTTYNNIMRYVNAGNAAQSKLYKVLFRSGSDRMPPPPNAPLSDAQKALLQKWINQGAKNNNCSGRCDTTTFTFSAGIKPMLANKCQGCHNPANLGGNIDLSTYAGVRTVALNGKLYASIVQQIGYSPMPKGAAKLSDCEIIQVRKWIAAGSLNN
jgi:hypothetical protein